jgi:hypothetical protein
MITIKIKDTFFDRKSVVNAVDRAQRSALSRIGAFVRTRARSSMRKRKKSAAAGSPPSVHEGGIKRLLFFGYDAANSSVVVGPVTYRKGDAPNLLEFGGTTTIKYRSGKSRSAKYQPFPFMGPALEKEVDAGTIPAQWANSVKGS